MLKSVNFQIFCTNVPITQSLNAVDAMKAINYMYKCESNHIFVHYSLIGILWHYR